MLSKFLQIIKSRQQIIFLGICIIFISIISYNLGRINALQKTPIKITSGANIFQATNIQTKDSRSNQSFQSTPKQPIDLRVIASKKSTTKKYHYLWCLGAKQIKEKNKLWFASAPEAELAGYTLADNCKL